MKNLLILKAIFVCLLIPFMSAGQQLNYEQLSELGREAEDNFLERQKRIEAYTEQNEIDERFHVNGVTYQLYDIDNGIPLYRITDNETAVQIVNARVAQAGGDLGLELHGKNVRMAIWEVGRAKTHQEFGNRIILNEGASPDSDDDADHANFVAGQLISEGINPSAKGITFEGTLRTYTSANDVSEMTNEAAEGLLVSNHSYGLGLGWQFTGSGWNWNGNASISETEDYRFGLYTNSSRQLDQLAYNSPKYLVIWSAGNHRNDVGDGTRPPDGGGTGFDTMGPDKVAKNSMAIGAINKQLNQIQIADFSSFGPTDDGRIKPDLVAPGTNILSTGSDSETHYYNSQGTSFASPLAAGVAVMIQEMRHKQTGTYFNSASVKALMIHTAKEAGSSEGPDYRYGWGLVDAGAAIQQLQNGPESGEIIEETLSNGEEYRYDVVVDANSSIKATVVWTDPAGTPPGNVVDPTDLMLVNDLDMRIVDEAGQEVRPWVLNPAAPSAPAIKSDNFRDNVEQVVLNNAEPRRYSIVVRHKGNLVNNQQDFSLVLNYERATPEQDVLYWIGGTGNWTDGANWSAESGGAAANRTPSSDTKVIIDENSFAQAGQIILPASININKLNWFSDNQVTMIGNSSQLNIGESIYVSRNTWSTEGTVEIVLPEGFNDADFGNSMLSSATVTSSSAEATLQNIGQLDGLAVLAGSLRLLPSESTTIGTIQSSGNETRILDINNVRIQGVENLQFSGSGLTFRTTNARIVYKDGIADGSFNPNNIPFNGTVQTGTANVSFDNISDIGSLISIGEINWLSPSGSVNNLELGEGALFSFADNSDISIMGEWIISTSEQPVVFSSENGASITLDNHVKYCFENVEVFNVDLVGSAVVSVGTNGIVENSDNWFSLACSDIPFPDFTFEYTCEQGLTKFTNSSSGNIDGYEWVIEGNTFVTEDISYSFPEAGIYDVVLTAVASSERVTYSVPVTVIPNPLPENEIIKDGIRFVSRELSDFYEWYRDGELIEGENERILESEEFGLYNVVTFGESCNRLSETFAIVGLEDDLEELAAAGIQVYPNPVDQNIFISGLTGKRVDLIEIISIDGREISSKSGKFADRIGFDLVNQPSGIYVVRIHSDNNLFMFKILKK